MSDLFFGHSERQRAKTKQNMKRLAIFRYLKQQHYDIICLQETHLTKQDIPIWGKQWGGKIIYVEGTAHSQGEMILI